MVELKLQESGLSEAIKNVMAQPGLFAAARKSAMKSVGWFVQVALRNHLEYGPAGWEKLHYLTEMFKKQGSEGIWALRSEAPRSPAQWLGRFSRYRVTLDGGWAQIDFGKSRKGRPGTFDSQIAPVARRIDKGENIAVTDKMRRKLAATREATKGGHAVGINFFPLRKGTTEIKIPARPIFSPVFNMVEPKIGPLFEQKFWAAYERYKTGVDNKT